MTSSLVGSEMCIRDRFIDMLIAQSVRAMNIWFQKPTSKLATYREPGVGSCLLYTSDAADDM
eukprot:3008855-Prorocentrum_lima.AAC.1